MRARAASGSGRGRWAAATVAVLVVLLLVAGCRSTERAEIHADGSATATASLTLTRDHPVFGALVDYDEIVEVAGDDPREFLREAMALESTPAHIDAVDVEVDGGAITVSTTSDVDSLDDLVELWSSHDDSATDGWWLTPTMADAAITETAEGLSLEADPATNLDAYLAEYLALEGERDLFRDAGSLGDLEELRGSSTTVELVLPGRIVEHNTDDTDGNMLRWHFTIGERAPPRITVTWDPTGEPDRGADDRSRGVLVGSGVAVLVALAALVITRFRRGRRASH